MAKLVPQIRLWLRTGFVASGKVINLHIPQLYSVVPGKVGKAVEFGLSWGITRRRGGFVLATMAATKTDLTDARYAMRAVEDLARLFGKQAWGAGGWVGATWSGAVGGRGQGEGPTHQRANGRGLLLHYDGSGGHGRPADGSAGLAALAVHGMAARRVQAPEFPDKP